jgi:hypothetical protein
MSFKPGPLWNQWRNIQQVCYNPNNVGYATNPGCYWQPKEYRKFEQYILSTIGPRPSPDYKLIRKNQKKPYQPGNFEWSLYVDHSNKMIRNCVWIKYRGRTQSMRAWSRELGIPYFTLFARHKKDLPIREQLYVGKLNARKN